jgi:predicted aldo/keto reductase-like oxidoreductase
MVRAFERLKKEGLVKHLAISQHHDNSIGRDMAWEILDYLADHQPYHATQFFYTYGDHKEVQEWIDAAKKKDIATVAMKTMGSVGRAAQDEKFKRLLADPKYQGSTPGAAMVKWLKSNQNLAAAVIATSNFDQIRENVGAAASLAMGPQDHAALGLLSGYNKGLTYLLCAKCVSSCPEHIGISDICRYERYARDYHDLDQARREYAALTWEGTSCGGQSAARAAIEVEVRSSRRVARGWVTRDSVFRTRANRRRARFETTPGTLKPRSVCSSW